MNHPDMEQEHDDFTRQTASEISHNRRRCCFFLPSCFDRTSSSLSTTVGLTWWQKVRTSEITDGGGNSNNNSLWARGVEGLKKIREWSEIVAGPRWKTFIRRFNRNRSGGGNHKHANFQYDPLSYAMNFDEGPGGQNGHFDEELDDGYHSRNFSSRDISTMSKRIDSYFKKDCPQATTPHIPTQSTKNRENASFELVLLNYILVLQKSQGQRTIHLLKNLIG